MNSTCRDHRRESPRGFGFTDFISQFFYQPERRAAYAVAANTTATPRIPGDAADKRNTRSLNQRIKQALFKTVFAIIPPEF